LGASVALAQPMPLAQPGLSEPAVHPTPNDLHEPLPLSMYPDAPPQPPQAPYGASSNGMPGLEPDTKGAFDKIEPDEQLHALFTAEWLHWWVHKSLPPIVTIDPTGSGNAILFQPNTGVVFGSNKDSEEHDGVRFSAGYWFDGMPFAVETNIYALLERGTRVDLSSDANGFPSLGRPVFDVLRNEETVLQISAPGQFAGKVQASSETQLFSADANVVADVTPWSCWWKPNLVVGFRYLDLQENLNVSQQSLILDQGVLGFLGSTLGPGNSVSVTDTFTTRNQFLGGQIGTRADWEQGHLYMNFAGTVGLGMTHQAVSANGSTTFQGFSNGSPPTPINVTVPGGLLALTSNMGRITHDEFSVVPEVGMTVGWHLAKWWDIYAGYSFIYWSGVLRPGQEVDRSVNPNFLPASTLFGIGVGADRPSLTLHQTDFWAHGLNVGMAFKF
jgi:hypothetical protein